MIIFLLGQNYEINQNLKKRNRENVLLDIFSNLKFIFLFQMIIRIIRNIILNIRWFSKATEEYISNLRYYMLREYFENFEKIIGTNSYDKLIKLKDNFVKETFNKIGRAHV